jgi:hypothetical protein
MCNNLAILTSSSKHDPILSQHISLLEEQNKYSELSVSRVSLDLNQTWRPDKFRQKFSKALA